jgi:hypothetical protein
MMVFFFLLFFCTHLTVLQPQNIYMMDTTDLTLDLVWNPNDWIGHGQRYLSPGQEPRVILQ